MSKIEISNLQPTGLNLFSDSESYLKDLAESEQNIQGGLFPLQVAGFVMMSVGAFGIGFAAAGIYKSGTNCALDF
jgi:hypothetical protein